MAFPSTSILTDFTVLSDGGPPPTADYDVGGMAVGGMVILGGVCAPDPENVDPTRGGNIYAAQSFNFPVETWAILGPVASSDFAVVLAINDDFGFFFQWLLSEGDCIYALLGDNDGLDALWVSSTNEFATIGEGGGLGMAVTASSVELYVSYDGSTWEKIKTVTGLTFPTTNPVYIGFGSLSVSSS